MKMDLIHQKNRKNKKEDGHDWISNYMNTQIFNVFRVCVYG